MTDEHKKRVGLSIAKLYTKSALQFENKYKDRRLADLDRYRAMGIIQALYTIGLLEKDEFNEKMEELYQLFDKKEAATVAETP